MAGHKVTYFQFSLYQGAAVKFCSAIVNGRFKMCTMDYVTHVLCLQGWQRAWCVEDYFAGWECDLDPEVSLNVPGDEVNTVITADQACQTPKTWLDFPQAQPPKKVETGSAPAPIWGASRPV